MLPHRQDRSGFFRCRKLTRRDCLRLLIGACTLLWLKPPSVARAAVKAQHRTILEKFLGEALRYQIGFWLIPHCGEAEADFSGTDLPGVYRIRLEGRTVGFIDLLLGRLRYSYVSYARYAEDEDRLKPAVFLLVRTRMGKESRRTVTFNYAAGEIVFSETSSDGGTRHHRESMTPGKAYEDYLTLLFNFRHGIYGPLERGRLYKLPLYRPKETTALTLYIASAAEQRKNQPAQPMHADKNFFLKFRVDRQDVSSGSGEIEGWLSSEKIPFRGTLKDVIFFGDLWGELSSRQMTDPSKIVEIPASVRKEIQLP